MQPARKRPSILMEGALPGKAKRLNHTPKPPNMKSLFSTFALAPMMMASFVNYQASETESLQETALQEKRKEALNYLPRITEIVYLGVPDTTDSTCD